MADDFVNPTNINWNGGYVGTVEYGSDRNMVVMFYNKSKPNKAKSAKNGRPVHEDVVHIKMYTPGEQRFNVIDRPATPQDKQRFASHWARFSANQEQVPDGTPIEMLYPEQPSIATTLRSYGVHTIEQCADLSGTAIEDIGMGSQRYVNSAKKYLELSEKGVKASQLRRELEERDGEIRTLKHQIELLNAQLDKLQEDKSNAVDLQTIQSLLAGVQRRPQYPDTKQLAPQFDAQTAQINATHKTSDMRRSRKKTRKRETLD